MTGRAQRASGQTKNLCTNPEAETNRELGVVGSAYLPFEPFQSL